MATGDLRDGGVRQHTTHSHRAVGGNREPRLARRIDHQRLVQIGMIFELIGDERNGRETGRLVEQSPIEIADAYMTDFARSHGLIEQTYLLGERHTVVRPMQQQEIDIFASQLPEALIDRRDEPTLRIVGDPDFRGDEYFGARDAGRDDTFAHLLLIAVDLRGVDVAEASLQRSRNDAQHVRASHAIRTKPDSGYFRSIGDNGMHQRSPLRL